MWIEATWHSPTEHSAPATQRPAGIPSRTIYGLIAYLCQIAERISSDPFDPCDDPLHLTDSVGGAVGFHHQRVIRSTPCAEFATSVNLGFGPP